MKWSEMWTSSAWSQCCSPSLRLSCSLLRSLFHVGWLFSHSVLETWTLCAHCLSSGEQHPAPSPQGHNLQKSSHWAFLLTHSYLRNYLLSIPDLLLRPWTNNNEPFPVLHGIVHSILQSGQFRAPTTNLQSNWRQKYRKERKVPFQTLWGRHCGARGNSPLALYGDVGEAHLDSGKHSMESGDGGSNLGLSFLVWDLWRAWGPESNPRNSCKNRRCGTTPCKPNLRKMESGESPEPNYWALSQWENLSQRSWAVFWGWHPRLSTGLHRHTHTLTSERSMYVSEETYSCNIYYSIPCKSWGSLNAYQIGNRSCILRIK